MNFNPLSAQAERQQMPMKYVAELEFQSTLRASRETFRLVVDPTIYDISIHSPRKQRDGSYYSVCQSDVISIHSPRKQRDSKYAQPLQSSHATVLCILNKSYNPNNNYHTITNHPQPFFQAFQVRRIQ